MQWRSGQSNRTRLCKGAAPNQHPLALVISVECDPAATAAIVDADPIDHGSSKAAAADANATTAGAAAAPGKLQSLV
jgi:hypothetical protein